jgi:hypothetical protein
MYCALSASMSACAAGAALLGLPIAPAFGPPSAATSLAAFWGRCWNLPQSLVLRALVFDPIAEGRWVRPPGAAPAAATSRRRRRIAALLATFVQSGLEHEAFRLSVKGGAPDWRLFAFFALQGPLVLLEGWAKRAWRAGGRRADPPPALAVAATLVALEFVALPLFWPSLEDAELGRRCAAALRASFHGAAALAPPPLREALLSAAGVGG